MSCNGSTLQLRSASTASQQCNGDTELRHLSPGYRNQIVSILDTGDSWKELAAIIPNPDKHEELLFSADNIKVLDGYKQRPDGSPSNALFEHWSTFGRKRPTIRSFCDLLREAKLHRAANVIAVEILGEPPIENEWESSSFCAMNALTETLAWNELVTGKTGATLVEGNGCQIATANGSDVCTLLKHHTYNALKIATENFSDAPVKSGGCRLGEGAFGTVYRGLLASETYVAIKRLKEKINPQFITEMEILSSCKHSNLLPLLGYSLDGPFGCLVYEYMENGSLQDCLAHSPDDTAIILWKTRINIAAGTARGICHLHTWKNEPYIHRDIKSANILLDKNLNPKVGDFGLVRMGSTSLTSTYVVTDNVFGTSVYMAPEAFRGDVSVKLDTFSFGVVLLELLTGLPPHDSSREESDILSHLEENCQNIEEFLDRKAGNWSQPLALDMYNVASKCTEVRKKNRPTMVDVLPTLEEILQKSVQLSVSLNQSSSFSCISYV